MAKIENVEQLVEAFTVQAAPIARRKGVKVGEVTVDSILKLALDGLKSKCYRKNYNTKRWGMLKAVKQMMEEKGLSLEDLMAGDDDAE